MSDILFNVYLDYLRVKQARSDSSKTQKNKNKKGSLSHLSEVNQDYEDLKTLLMPTTFFPLLVTSEEQLKKQKIDF